MPDQEEAIEASDLERSRRRLRSDENEQVAPSSVLTPACSQEEGERGRVEEGHGAQIDHDAARSLARVLLGLDGVYERALDLGGAVEIQLAGENEDGCPVCTALEGEREVERRHQLTPHRGTAMRGILVTVRQPTSISRGSHAVDEVFDEVISTMRGECSR